MKSSILLIALMILVSFPAVQAATLTLSPATSSVYVGDIFTVDIMLNTQGQQIDGVDIRYLNFDPALLQVEDSNTGTTGVQIASGTLMSVTSINTVDNAAGRVSFSQIVSGGTNYNGQGILARITFRAIAAGTAPVTFSFTSGSTTDANVAAGGVDVLSVVNAGSYTVSSPGGGDTGGTGGGGGSGGGGSGGGLPPANLNKQMFSITGSNVVTIHLNTSRTAIESIMLELSHYVSASLTVEKQTMAGMLPGGVAYQQVSITEQGLKPALILATINFRVPKQWIIENGLDVYNITMYRLGQTWEPLITTLTEDRPDYYTYAAKTLDMGIFAIVGGNRTTSQDQHQNQTQDGGGTPQCVQVKTFATNGTHCIEYNTSCDVPAGWTIVDKCQTKTDEQQLEDMGDILTIFIAIVTVIVFAVAIHKIRKRKRRRSREPAISFEPSTPASHF
jgi:PGF-pre-PGF domain-containing protein